VAAASMAGPCSASASAEKSTDVNGTLDQDWLEAAANQTRFVQTAGGGHRCNSNCCTPALIGPSRVVDQQNSLIKVMRICEILLEEPVLDGRQRHCTCDESLLSWSPES